jgi:hypothetical protein
MRLMDDAARAFEWSLPAMANANENATANAPASTSPTVALFQKAHAKMVTLQRVDEQLQSLLDQRKRLQDELRGVQALINEEFERVMRDAEDGPARMIAQYEEAAAGVARRNGKDGAIRMEVAQAM